ncbi:MAG: hypothetical protein ACO1OT_14930 [Heyndrickxia sp.]
MKWSTPSLASGLEPKASDSNGSISCTWEVSTRTEPETYNVIINVMDKQSQNM